MREVGYGKIVDLKIHNGEPAFDSPTQIIKDIALDKTNDINPYKSDETLKPQVTRMLNQFSKIRDGTIPTIRIQDGLPFRLQVNDQL